MKKIKMIYNRDGDKVLDTYCNEYKNYDKSKLLISAKIDGTACMIKDGKFYKRYDSKNKIIDLSKIDGGIFCYRNEKHTIGGVPVNSHTDKYHSIGLGNLLHLTCGNKLDSKENGTYELVGPKVNGNKHNFVRHMLLKHQDMILYGYKVAKDKQGGIALIKQVEENNNPGKIEGFVLGDKEKMEPMFKIRKNDLIKGGW